MPSGRGPGANKAIFRRWNLPLAACDLAKSGTVRCTAAGPVGMDWAHPFVKNSELTSTVTAKLNKSCEELAAASSALDAGRCRNVW
jgi:hypothetical protein